MRVCRWEELGVFEQKGFVREVRRLVVVLCYPTVDTFERWSSILFDTP
jgi:hypothetical protein